MEKPQFENGDMNWRSPKEKHETCPHKTAFSPLVFQESDKWKKRKEKVLLRTQITATPGNYSPIYSREKSLKIAV
jgi:hypothetical protein